MLCDSRRWLGVVKPCSGTDTTGSCSGLFFFSSFVMKGNKFCEEKLHHDRANKDLLSFTGCVCDDVVMGWKKRRIWVQISTRSCKLHKNPVP